MTIVYKVYLLCIKFRGRGKYTITLYNPSYTNLYVTVFIVKHNDKRQGRADALISK